MKICFYCDTLFSFGGVQRVLAVIAKALSERHEVTILTHDHPTAEDRTMYELQRPDIHFRYIAYPPLSIKEYLPCKAYSFLYKKVLPQNRLTSRWYGQSSFSASQQQVLIESLNAGGYDVVVGVHVFLSLKLASVRARLRAQRVVGWMHNSYQAFFEQQPSYLEGLKTFFQHQMPRLDDVVVLTHTDAERYRQQLNLNPKIIYNPLTLAPQGRSDPQAKKFLAVGRFSPRHKGFDILIKGFALFATQNSEWTLDIVGEGPEEALLRGLITQHGLSERIQIHPFTKNIQSYYSSASVYVLSSRWEGFPLVLAEAMAHGLPLIASDIPVVCEFLQNKGVAYIFASEQASQLADAMLQAASATLSLAQMGEAAYLQAESLQLSAIEQQWEKILSLG